MKNKEQTKDYLIIRHYGYAIEVRFRTLTEELYNDLNYDYNNNDDDCDKAIFEYDESIKNFTWENYEHYLKGNPQNFDTNELFCYFDPDYIDCFGKKEIKIEVEKIIKELKNIKNTRTYVYWGD